MLLFNFQPKNVGGDDPGSWEKGTPVSSAGTLSAGLSGALPVFPSGRGAWIL
jgi:hypothetical protein